MTVASSIADRAVLVSFNVGYWSGRKKDKKVTRDVAQRHNAEESKAGLYTKYLIDPGAAEFKAVMSAINSARDYHLEQTLPWLDKGARVLLAANFLDYSSGIREKQDAIRAAVRKFEAVYPDLKEAHRKHMNGLHDERDYPSIPDLRERFYAKVTTLPFPTKDDFRVDIGMEELNVIKNQLASASAEALENAMRDVWTRLYEPVRHMADKLADPKAVFRDTLISNVADIAKLLPRLNLTNDPELEDLGAVVTKALARANPQTLRDDSGKREEAARAAAAVARRMEAFMQPQKVAA